MPKSVFGLFCIFRKTIFMRFLITACFLLAYATGFAQMPDSNMMKRWMAYMTPGKEHQMMASWDGTWNGDITMWMMPGAPPTKSKGVATNKMILGGRYQQSSYTGSFEGMPFEGLSTMGFDNEKKTFICTWIDNMGSGMMIGEGPWDEAGRSITIKGTMIDPTTGKECNFRQVMRIVDNDHQVTEMYVPGPDGKEYKSMEIKSTRKK
jgi:hypothetical protein